MPRVAFYRHRGDNVPRSVDASWDELVGLLGADESWAGPCTLNDCAGHDCPNKDRSPRSFAAWSPVRLVDGTTRLNDHVIAVTALVLDLDGVHSTVAQEVARRLEGWRHAAHSTHADRLNVGGLASLRITVAVEAEVPAASWRAYRVAAIAHLGLDDPRFQIDPTCKDLSRLYFLPSSPIGYAPIYAHGDGAALPASLAPPASLIPPARSIVPPPVHVAPVAPPAQTGAIDLLSLRRALAEDRRSLSHRADAESRSRADLIGRVLEGKPIAEPGGRGGTIYRAASVCAFCWPVGTPVEAFVEVIRASMSATSTAPTPGSSSTGAVDHWPHAIDCYRRASAQRAVKFAEEETEKGALTARLVAGARSRSSVSGVAPAGEQQSTGTSGSTSSDDVFLLNTDRTMKACGENARRLIEGVLPGVFRWDDYRKQISVATPPGLDDVVRPRVEQWPTVHPDHLGAHVADALTTWTWAHKVVWPVQDVERRIALVADKHKFDPLHEYMQHCRSIYDGGSRIDTAFSRYFGAEDTPHMRRISRRWFVGANERAMWAGCKFDALVTLEQRGGAKKTSGIEALAGEFFCSTVIDIRDKDSMMLAGSNFLLCLDELAGKITGDLRRELKEFVTRRTDCYRRPYGRGLEWVPRRSVLAATTDQEAWLTDPWGNRRYWCVRCGVIDVPAILADRDQLWGEAMFLREQSENCLACLASSDTVFGQRPRCEVHRWWLDALEEAVAALDVAEREADEPWMAKIADWWTRMLPARRPEYVTTIDVATGAITGLTADRVTKTVRDTIAAIMRGMRCEDGSPAFEARRLRIDGVRQWVYVPTASFRAVVKPVVVAPTAATGSQPPTQGTVLYLERK